MSKFRLFCFKQFYKVHIFCLLMMVVFRLFMNVNWGLLLWVVIIISTFCIGIYLFHKPIMVTKDVYAVMAISSCISLSIIAQRFLFTALRIDIVNMLYFFLSMIAFAAIVLGIMKITGWRRRRGIRRKIGFIKFMRYLGWGFLVFLFFYQIVLSYLLRPNFLTVMALSVSHANLLLIIWTYFDVRRLYRRKRYYPSTPYLYTT